MIVFSVCRNWHAGWGGIGSRRTRFARYKMTALITECALCLIGSLGRDPGDPFSRATLTLATEGMVQSTSTADAGGARWKCGPNSLYMFVRMHGATVSYNEIEQNVKISESGVSILQLRDTARSVGVQADVRRYLRLHDLSRCRLPLIAHLHTETTTSGHFVLIVSIAESAVSFIDGTTGQLNTGTIHGLED